MIKILLMCLYHARVLKEIGVDSNDDQAYMEDDPNEEEMDDVNLDNETKRHWRMVLEDNDGGVDDTKSLLHDKRWDSYVNEKVNLVKGGYLVEFDVHDRKKFLWGVVNNHVVE